MLSVTLASRRVSWSIFKCSMQVYDYDCHVCGHKQAGALTCCPKGSFHGPLPRLCITGCRRRLSAMQWPSSMFAAGSPRFQQSSRVIQVSVVHSVCTFWRNWVRLGTRLITEPRPNCLVTVSRCSNWRTEGKEVWCPVGWFWSRYSNRYRWFSYCDCSLSLCLHTSIFEQIPWKSNFWLAFFLSVVLPWDLE